MTKKDGTLNPEQPQPVQTDAFTAFDAALGSLKEEKVQLRTRREQVTKVKEAAEKNMATFEELIVGGTYENLENFPFALFVNSLGVELDQQLAPDLDKQMKIVADAKERLAKYNQLPEKDKEKLKSIAEAMKLPALEAMKSVLKQIFVGFEELRERQRLELETTEGEARAILDSPIFDSEVRIEEESYEDYRDRVAREVAIPFSDGAARRIENRFWDKTAMTRQFGEGSLWEWITREICSQKLSINEALERYHAMRKEIQDLLAAGMPARDVPIENLMKKYFHTDYVFELKGEQKEFASGQNRTAQEFRNMEEMLKEREVVRTGTRSFTEERIRMAIKAIESECQTEEERRNALEFLKTKLVKWVPDVQMRGSDRVLSFAFDMPEHQFDLASDVPRWFWEACRRINEAKIFFQMIFIREGEGENVVKLLTCNQMLRELLGETAFGGRKKEEETVRFGSSSRYCQRVYTHDDAMVGIPWPKMIVDDDLISRSMGLVELLGRADFYNGQEYETFAWLGKTLNLLLPRKTFKFHSGGVGEGRQEKIGSLELGARERKEQERWLEGVIADSAEPVPVGEDEIARIIAEKGYYPMRTLPEAVKMIDALKNKVLVTLQREQAARAAISPEKKRTESAERASAEAKKAGDELRETIASLQRQLGELKGVQEAKEKARSELDLLRKQGKEEKLALKTKLQGLKEQIEAELRGIQEISGLFGAEAKKRAALEALLREVQEKLGSI